MFEGALKEVKNMSSNNHFIRVAFKYCNLMVAVFFAFIRKTSNELVSVTKM